MEVHRSKAPQRWRVTIGAFLLASCAWSTHPEIVKTASLDCGDNKICFYWWPKLPPMPGWHTDMEANASYGGNGINSLVADGSTFATADAVMYAAATYKPRYEAQNPKAKSLAAFIEDDTKSFAGGHKGIVIAEVNSLTTADGQLLRSFTYFMPRDQTWERVTYGEEGEFYLVFTVSAHSQAGYRKAVLVYEDLVRRYRK